MKKVYLLVDIKVDSRFTLPEVKFHLKRAIEDYINSLEDDDELGIELGEVTLVDVDPRKVSGGNT